MTKTRIYLSLPSSPSSSADLLPSSSTPPSPRPPPGATNGGGGGPPQKNHWNKIPEPGPALLEATPILGEPSSWPDLSTASKKKAPCSCQAQIASPTPVASSIGETSNLPLPPSTPPPSLMSSDPVVELNNDLLPSSAMTYASIPLSEPRQEGKDLVQVTTVVLQTEYQQHPEQEEQTDLVPLATVVPQIEDQQQPEQDERTDFVPLLTVVPQTEHQQQPEQDERTDLVPLVTVVPQTEHQQQPEKESVDSVAVVLQTMHPRQLEQEPKDSVSVPTVVLQMEYLQQKRQEKPTGLVPVVPTVLQVKHQQESQTSVPASGMNPRTLIHPPHSRTSGQNNWKGRNNFQQHQNYKKNSCGRYQQRQPYHQGKLNHQFCANQGGVHPISNNFYSEWNQDRQQRPLHFSDRFSCGGFGAMVNQHWPILHGPPFVDRYYHLEYKDPNGFCYTEPYFRDNMEVYGNGFYDLEPSFQGNMEIYRNGFYDLEPSFQGNMKVYRNGFCDPVPSFELNMEVYPNDIYCPEPCFQDVSASRNHAPSVSFLSPALIQTPTQVVPLPLFGTPPLPAGHPQSLSSPLHMSMARHKFSGGLVPHSQLTAVALGKKNLDLKTKLCKQIDFYFSDSNLASDKYLKSKMDREGWVSVNEIACFNRVRSMTTNVSLILEALQSSDVVEVSGNKMRKGDNGGRWISPEQGPLST